MKTMKNQFAVILPAAGSGRRFGGGDKLLRPLMGQTVLQRAVALFSSRDDVACIIVATQPDRLKSYHGHVLEAAAGKPLIMVAGGEERGETVIKAILVVPPGIQFIAVHDAARPLTPPEVIDDVFAAALQYGAALPVVVEPATLKRVNADATVRETVRRKGLFQAQTPQCFTPTRMLEAITLLAARGARAPITDDVQILERAGQTVVTTAGSPLNIKITTGDDIILAEAILMARATASGRQNLPATRKIEGRGKSV